jgi:hypothetical protein
MLMHDILIERTSDDLSAQARATAAFHLFANYVYQGAHAPHFTIDIKGRGEFYGFDCQQIGFDSEFDDMVILIGLRNKRSVVMAGATWHLPMYPLNGKYRRAICMNALREFKASEISQAVNSTAFISTFEHEFIHILDSARTNNKIMGTKSRPDGTSKAAYYNDPAEFNAFFHTFCSAWLACLTATQQNPETGRDLADIYDITGDFSADLTALMQKDSHSRDFFKHLSLPRRRAIIRRLYLLHKELTDLLNPR